MKSDHKKSKDYSYSREFLSNPALTGMIRGVVEKESIPNPEEKKSVKPHYKWR